MRMAGPRWQARPRRGRDRHRADHAGGRPVKNQGLVVGMAGSGTCALAARGAGGEPGTRTAARLERRPPDRVRGLALAPGGEHTTTGHRAHQNGDRQRPQHGHGHRQEDVNTRTGHKAQNQQRPPGLAPTNPGCHQRGCQRSPGFPPAWCRTVWQTDGRGRRSSVDIDHRTGWVDHYESRVAGPRRPSHLFWDRSWEHVRIRPIAARTPRTAGGMDIQAGLVETGLSSILMAPYQGFVSFPTGLPRRSCNWDAGSGRCVDGHSTNVARGAHQGNRSNRLHLNGLHGTCRMWTVGGSILGCPADQREA